MRRPQSRVHQFVLTSNIHTPFDMASGGGRRDSGQGDAFRTGDTNLPAVTSTLNLSTLSISSLPKSAALPLVVPSKALVISVSAWKPTYPFLQNCCEQAGCHISLLLRCAVVVTASILETAAIVGAISASPYPLILRSNNTPKTE